MPQHFCEAPPTESPEHRTSSENPKCLEVRGIIIMGEVYDSIRGMVGAGVKLRSVGGCPRERLPGAVETMAAGLLLLLLLLPLLLLLLGITSTTTTTSTITARTSHKPAYPDPKAACRTSCLMCAGRSIGIRIITKGLWLSSCVRARLLPVSVRNPDRDCDTNWYCRSSS